MVRKLLKMFGLSKSMSTEDRKLLIESRGSTNSYVASGFEDVVEGLQFSPTFNFSTPCKILRSDGVCVEDKEHIPDFLRVQRQGIWLPKVKSEYSLLGDIEDVGASDAYGAKRDDYISYVCGVKDIYLGDGNIFDRVTEIDNFRTQHPHLLYVEEKLLKSYRAYHSIVDLLMFIIGAPYEDIVLYRFEDKNYLRPILGVNTRIEQSLVSEGYETVKDIVSLSKEQLITLNGIGSKSAEKIAEKMIEIKEIIDGSKYVRWI